MEWVAFWTNDTWDIANYMNPKYEINIKCKTGLQNLKAHQASLLIIQMMV